MSIFTTPILNRCCSGLFGRGKLGRRTEAPASAQCREMRAVHCLAPPLLLFQDLRSMAVNPRYFIACLVFFLHI